MTANQAAEYLGVHIDMLRRFEKAGLVVYRLGDGPKAPRRFYRADLDEFVRSRCSTETPANRIGAA